MIYKLISFIFLTFLFIESKSQNYKIFEINGNEGVIRSGDTTIKAEYDDVMYLGGCDWSYFAVKKNGKYAIWNYDIGKLDFQFDYIYLMSDYFGKEYSDASFVIAVVDDKVGMINISSCYYSSDINIKPKYKSFYISNAFLKNGGNYIIKAEINNDSSDFYLIDEMLESNARLLKHLKGVKEIYPVNSESIYDENVFIFEKNSKYGIANFNEITLESKYDSIEFLDISDYILFEISKNGKKNVFSYYTLQIIYPKFFSNISNYYYNDALLSSVYEGDKCYIFSNEFQFDTIEPISSLFLYNLYFDDFKLIDNQYAFVKLDDKWALVNEFDFLTDFTFNKPTHWKFKINRAQKKWKKKYDGYLNSEDSIYYKENGKYGLNEYLLTPPIFDTIIEYNNTLIIRYKDVYGLYIDGNIHKFNIQRFEFPDDSSNPLFKVYYKNRFKYINSINNPFFNNMFYDAILKIDSNNFLAFYNGKLGGYSPLNFQEIPPIFDSIFLPYGDGKMKIAYYNSFILPIYEYDYISNPIVFNEFKKDLDLKDFIYLRDSSNWTFKYKSLNFYSNTFENTAEIKSKYVDPILSWKSAKIKSGFEIEKFGRSLFKLKKGNITEIHYFNFTRFFRDAKDYKYLIYSGNADSVVLKDSHILIYKNGFFKPMYITKDSEFNNHNMLFKSYNRNGPIPYYTDENQKKYFVLNYEFVEFDEVEYSSIGRFFLFKKGEKYAVLDASKYYFSGFQFEDVSFSGLLYNGFAFQQNEKWGIMVLSNDFNSINSEYEIKLNPDYKSAKQAFRKY